MDSWERFDVTSLPDKEAFYNNINIKALKMLTIESKKKIKKFNIKNLGIMIYMFKVIFYCLQMCLKTL